MAWFEQERANLLAAAHQAVHGPVPMPRFAVRLAEVMYWFPLIRTNWHEMESINELALCAARRDGDRRGEAVALNDIGQAHLGAGSLDHAIACLERSRAIFAELGDRHWESITIVHQAVAYREQGELERTVDCLRRSLPCLHEVGDLVTVGGALGEREQARSCWHGAQAVFKHLGVPITDRRFRSVWV